jgi:hypothetical protein
MHCHFGVRMLFCLCLQAFFLLPTTKHIGLSPPPSTWTSRHNDMCHIMGLWICSRISAKLVSLPLPDRTSASFRLRCRASCKWIVGPQRVFVCTERQRWIVIVLRDVSHRRHNTCQSSRNTFMISIIQVWHRNIRVYTPSLMISYQNLRQKINI